MTEVDKAMAYKVQKGIFENACKRLKAEDMAWDERDKSHAEMEEEKNLAEMEKNLAVIRTTPEDKEMEDKSLGEMEDSDDWEAEARKRELQMDPEAVKAVERKTIKEAE